MNRVTLALVLPFLASLLAGTASAQSPPVWRLQPDLRIGREEPDYTFTQIGAVLPRGTLVYVLQPDEQRVRVYDLRGRFVRSIGSKGRGPGEFQSPARMGFRGDTLWVSDPVQRRMSLFTLEGRHVQSFSFLVSPLAGRHVPYSPGALLSDRSILGEVLVSDATLSAGNEQEYPLLTFGPSGEVRDTVAKLPTGHMMLEIQDPRGGVTVTRQPFSDTPLFDVAPDGSFIVLVGRAAASSTSAFFQVGRLTPRGRAEFFRRYYYTPTRLSRDTVDALADRYVAGMSDRRGGTPTLPAAKLKDEFRRALYRPSFLPPVISTKVGMDGTIWLRREARGSRHQSWMLLDPRGRLLATVQVPLNSTVVYADRSQVWTVEKDGLDVPRLVRNRLVPARPARAGR